MVQVNGAEQIIEITFFCCWLKNGEKNVSIHKACVDDFIQCYNQSSYWQGRKKYSEYLLETDNVYGIDLTYN